MRMQRLARMTPSVHGNVLACRFGDVLASPTHGGAVAHWRVDQRMRGIDGQPSITSHMSRLYPAIDGVTVALGHVLPDRERSVSGLTAYSRGVSPTLKR